MLSQKIVIKNPSGLHMRPASNFVQLVTPFKSDVSFTKGSDSKFNAKSLMKVLSAGVKTGDEIELFVDGEDEKEALEAIITAIESGLGE
jgi:phosphocarrier protein